MGIRDGDWCFGVLAPDLCDGVLRQPGTTAGGFSRRTCVACTGPITRTKAQRVAGRFQE